MTTLGEEAAVSVHDRARRRRRRRSFPTFCEGRKEGRMRTDGRTDGLYPAGLPTAGPGTDSECEALLSLIGLALSPSLLLLFSFIVSALTERFFAAGLSQQHHHHRGRRRLPRHQAIKY